MIHYIKNFVRILALLIPVLSFGQAVDGPLKTLLCTTGSDTYVVSEALPAAYDPKERFLIRFTTGNTGTASLNRAGLGAKTILNNGVTLATGDIVALQEYLMAYDGTNYQCLTCRGASGGGGSGLPIDNTGTLATSGDVTLTFDKDRIYTVTPTDLLTFVLAGSGNVVGATIKIQVVGNGVAGVFVDQNFVVISGSYDNTKTNQFYLQYISPTQVITTVSQNVSTNLYLTPAGIPNCVAWFDGADAATVTDAGTITWTDKSAAANNWSAAAGADHPTFNAGLKAMQFDGVSNVMSWASTPSINSQNFTVFLVQKSNATPRQDIIFTQAAAGTNYFGWISNNLYFDGFTMGGEALVANTNKNLITIVGSTNISVFVNTVAGITHANITSTTTGWQQFGRYVTATSESFNGNLHALVLYNRVLTAPEIAKVSAYLNSQFSIY